MFCVTVRGFVMDTPAHLRPLEGWMSHADMRLMWVKDPCVGGAHAIVVSLSEVEEDAVALDPQKGDELEMEIGGVFSFTYAYEGSVYSTPYFVVRALKQL